MSFQRCASVKPCIVDAVFTLIGAAWTVLMLFTFMFRVCTFCYLVNWSSKASGSKPTPLTESNLIKWDLWKFLILSISGAQLGATQPRTLPVSVLTWQVLDVSLLLQSAQKKLSGITNVSQGGGLVLALQHPLQSILVVLLSIKKLTCIQKHLY